MADAIWGIVFMITVLALFVGVMLFGAWLDQKRDEKSNPGPRPTTSSERAIAARDRSMKSDDSDDPN